MSSANFIPMLSSSPPAMGDSFDDSWTHEDDDGFGDFGKFSPPKTDVPRSKNPSHPTDPSHQVSGQRQASEFASFASFQDSGGEQEPNHSWAQFGDINTRNKSEDQHQDDFGDFGSFEQSSQPISPDTLNDNVTENVSSAICDKDIESESSFNVECRADESTVDHCLPPVGQECLTTDNLADKQFVDSDDMPDACPPFFEPSRHSSASDSPIHFKEAEVSDTNSVDALDIADCEHEEAYQNSTENSSPEKSADDQEEDLSDFATFQKSDSDSSASNTFLVDSGDYKSKLSTEENHQTEAVSDGSDEGSGNVQTGDMDGCIKRKGVDNVDSGDDASSEDWLTKARTELDKDCGNSDEESCQFDRKDGDGSSEGNLDQVNCIGTDEVLESGMCLENTDVDGITHHSVVDESPDFVDSSTLASSYSEDKSTLRKSSQMPMNNGVASEIIPSGGFDNEDDFGNFDSHGQDGQNVTDFSVVENVTNKSVIDKSSHDVANKLPCVVDEGDEQDAFGDFADFDHNQQDGNHFSEDERTNDDWAAFDSAADQNEDDGWASFQGPASNKNVKFGELKPGSDDDHSSAFTGAGQDEFGDFADFKENHSSVSKNDDVDEDDDFGGFADGGASVGNTRFPQDEVSSRTAHQPDIEHSCTSKPTGLSRVEQLIDACFHAPLSINSSGKDNCLTNLLEIGNEKVKGEAPVDRWLPLWSDLCDIDHSVALQYTWNQSKNRKNLLTALHIDTRNLLVGHKKQSVPIFATDLGLLQPTKGPLEDRTGAAAQLVDTSKEAPLKEDTLPPVDFDWSSSGLTDPLESKPSNVTNKDGQANALLDLDFFSTNNSQSSLTSKPSDLESEFLSTSSVPSVVSHKTLQPLESLLSKFTPTMSTIPKTKEKQCLSEEAARIVSRFPDLSFMKSNVLMFPLKTDTN